MEGCQYDELDLFHFQSSWELPFQEKGAISPHTHTILKKYL
jgi:hypothetical protein